MTEGIQAEETLDQEPLRAAFVDDNPVIREMTQAMLQGSFDSPPEVFGTPQEVIDRFEKEDRPNVLLTDGDLGEGEMTGLELARNIKNRFPATTIVLISGGIPNVNINDPKVLEAHSIDLYLPKPVLPPQMRELPNRIRALRLLQQKP